MQREPEVTRRTQNVIFATGAKGIDNTEILKKNDWKPVKSLIPPENFPDILM